VGRRQLTRILFLDDFGVNIRYVQIIVKTRANGAEDNPCQDEACSANKGQNIKQAGHYYLGTYTLPTALPLLLGEQPS